MMGHCGTPCKSQAQGLQITIHIRFSQQQGKSTATAFSGQQGTPVHSCLCSNPDFKPAEIDASRLLFQDVDVYHWFY
jgi:hypothetical protein